MKNNLKEKCEEFRRYLDSEKKDAEAQASKYATITVKTLEEGGEYEESAERQHSNEGAAIMANRVKSEFKKMFAGVC